MDAEIELLVKRYHKNNLIYLQWHLL